MKPEFLNRLGEQAAKWFNPQSPEPVGNYHPHGDVPAGTGGMLPGRRGFEVAHDAHDLIPTITGDGDVAPFVEELLTEGKAVVVQSAGGNNLNVTFADDMVHIEHNEKKRNELIAVGITLAATGLVAFVYVKHRKKGQR